MPEKMLCAGMAACTADIVSFPLDVNIYDIKLTIINILIINLKTCLFHSINDITGGQSTITDIDVNGNKFEWNRLSWPVWYHLRYD